MSDSKGEMDLKTLLRTMKPKLHDKDLFVFLTIKSGSIPEEIENCSVFSMKEAEGRTFVIPKKIAENHGFEFEYPCRMITLQIHSSLSAVGEYTLRQKSIFGQVCICCSHHFKHFRNIFTGFLATILKRLAENEISCNVVSGFYHDHLFVSDGEEVKVMNILQNLSDQKKEE